MSLPLSVLDQSPIAEGSTGADALRNSVDLAKFAEEAGYRRYWVAEHHGTPMLACASPEILIGAIAAATERIRVGSGGVEALPSLRVGGQQVGSAVASDEPWQVGLVFGVMADLGFDVVDRASLRHGPDVRKKTP